MSGLNNISQQDFERYIQNRRTDDPRFRNIPLNRDFGNENILDESSSETSSEELESEEDNISMGQKKSNRILSNNFVEKDISKTNIKKHTLIINSIDRDLYDPSQNRFSFQVKFAPADSNCTRKYPIYENSQYFLQTEYQKKKGIQGFLRNIDNIKINEENGIEGYFNAFNEISIQEGFKYYDPIKPRGELIGYNYLIEKGTEGAFIEREFNNIHSIEIKKLLIPSKIGSFPWNISMYGDPNESIPYIYVTIPELTTNYSSTTSELRDSFCVMVQDRNQNGVLNMNTFTYLTYVPIDDNPYIYTPPLSGLNMITITINVPGYFPFIPSAIQTRLNSTPVVPRFNNLITENYQLASNTDNVDIQQIVMFSYKQEPSESIWKRRAQLSGVPQPQSFLYNRDIYDCPKGPFNKCGIPCFAIITQTYFNKDVIFPSSSIVFKNFKNTFSKSFKKENIQTNRENPLSLEHYIPNMFYECTEESQQIWTDNDVRIEGRELLLTNIIDIMGKIEGYFNSPQGIPILEVGFVKKQEELLEKEVNLLNPEILSNKLRNCYQYLNNYINVKHWGLDIDKIPFCNVKNTNQYTEPCQCSEINSSDEHMSGLCCQYTSNDFGDYSGAFLYTKYGFYKGLTKPYRPEGCVIKGSSQTTAKNSFYSDELCPIDNNIYDIDAWLLSSSYQYNGGVKPGTIDFYCLKQGISDLNDKACNIKNIEKQIIINKKYESKNLKKIINYSSESLVNKYKELFSNIKKLENSINGDNEYKSKLLLFDNNFKLLVLNIDNFFGYLKELINNENTELLLYVSEIENILDSFHISTIKPILDIDYAFLKDNINDENIKNPLQIIQNYKKTQNSDIIFESWYHIIFIMEIFIELSNFWYFFKFDNIKKTDNNIDIINNFEKFIQSLNIVNNKINSLNCDDVCIEWGLSIGAEGEECYKPSCESNPNPELANNDNDYYPEWQNSYCNGKDKDNENNLCKTCCKFTRGSNADGLCNVIIIPYPSVLYPIEGYYSPYGINEKYDKEWNNLPNLGYNKDDKKIFNDIISSMAFSICKEVLYNGGPLSFPVDIINKDNYIIERPVKILSITDQNTFVFEIKTVEPNINRIIQ